MATNTVTIIREGKPDWHAKTVANWHIGKDKFNVVESEIYDNRFSLWQRGQRATRGVERMTWTEYCAAILRLRLVRAANDNAKL